MNIRNKVYWAIDAQKKSLVAKQLSEIEKINNSDAYAQKKIEELKKNLLEHINKNVPYYREMKVNIFDELPVVNKIMMKEDFNSFRADNGMKITKIRHTTGSTGIPFEIVQDEVKAKRIQAELVYYRKETGDELGTKFINLITPSRVENMSYLSTLKQNVVPFDVTHMDDETMENLYSLLKNNKKIYYMLGYASALEKIANYFYEHNYFVDYSLKAIVSSSEILTDSTMNKLKRVFNCKVYDRYSNEDNGFIAQTNGETRDFFINRASYYIEILKMDSDEKAEENEIGRIVITDLFNYAQPFVRYDTGDLGSYSFRKLNGANRMVLTKLAGRRSDVLYDQNNKAVNTFAIGCALEIFDKIKQYQVIQNGYNDFSLKINGDKNIYSKDEYIEALREALGKEANIEVIYVKEIPSLNSGKFKRIICNYKPENV